MQKEFRAAEDALRPPVQAVSRTMVASNKAKRATVARAREKQPEANRLRRLAVLIG